MKVHLPCTERKYFTRTTLLALSVTGLCMYQVVNFQEIPILNSLLGISDKLEKGTYTARTNQYYTLFQSTKEIEFPTVEGKTSRIPHIIHQIYHKDTVPSQYAEYIKSFLDKNPGWEYRFWTYDSGRKLLTDRHPYLLRSYDQYGKYNVEKSDMLRCVVLYEFGGIYADLDVKNLRPLDKATEKYACIFPTEPFEHAVILHHRRVLLSSAVILCRPRHPFFKQVLENMKVIPKRISPIISTGPGFLTRQYFLYNNITVSNLNKFKIDWTSNAPYFYQGNRSPTADDAVYIPNAQYFSDNVDERILREDGNPEVCIQFMSLPILSKRACVESESRKTVRKNQKYTFTVHHWHHLWLKKKTYFQTLNHVHIQDVAPQCVLYQ